MWKFWWSGSLDKRSMHWLPWDRMSMPKGQGEWPRDTSTGVSSRARKTMIPIDHQRSGRFLFPRSHWWRGPWRRRVWPNRRNCLSTSSTYWSKTRSTGCRVPAQMGYKTGTETPTKNSMVTQAIEMRTLTHLWTHGLLLVCFCVALAVEL